MRALGFLAVFIFVVLGALAFAGQARLWWWRRTHRRDS